MKVNLKLTNYYRIKLKKKYKDRLLRASYSLVIFFTLFIYIYIYIIIKKYIEIMIKAPLKPKNNINITKFTLICTSITQPHNNLTSK